MIFFIFIFTTLFLELLDHGVVFPFLLGRQDGVDLFPDLVPHFPDMLEEIGLQFLDPVVVFLEDLPDLVLLLGRQAQILRPTVVRGIALGGAGPPAIRFFRQDPALAEDSPDDTGRENQDEGQDDPKLGFFHGQYLRLGRRSFPAKMIIMFLFSIFSSLNSVLVSARGLMFLRSSASG